MSTGTNAPRPRPDFTLYGLQNPTTKTPAASRRAYSTSWSESEKADARDAGRAARDAARQATRGTVRPRSGICGVCKLATRALNADDVCARCARTSAVPLTVPPTSTADEVL